MFEKIYHTLPTSKIVIHSSRSCLQTITLLLTGFRWRKARDRFNDTINTHFLSNQERNRRAFLARVYLQSKCEEGNSPAENLFLAAMIKKYDTKGVCIS